MRNYFRAGAAGLNAALWSFYTFLASLATWFVGGIIVTVIMLARDAQLRSLLVQQPPKRQEALDYLAGKNLLVPSLFLVVCSIGGYLWIRHLILKRASAADR